MDIYKRNLEALAKTHPHLVQMVENTSSDSDNIIVSRSLAGQLQVAWKRTDGPEVVITDSNDLSSIPEKAKNLLAQEKGIRVILLLGFGLGSYPKVLHENLRGDGMLIVYEAIPELFKIALQGQNLTSLLSSERFKLILGEETEDVSFVSKYHHKIVHKNFYILNQNGCVALNEPAYERFRTKVTEAKRLSDSSVVTGITRGAEWADAFIRNIAVILRTPGVIRLKDIFKERPAIIVSAGPSIEKNFHLLKEAKGKAIIIAVDVVVPTILPAGIIPDFIVALEANRKLYRAFEDNPLLKFCPLICTTEVDYETMTSLYPGPVFLNFSNPHPVLRWLHKCWEDKGFVAQPGGSVSHMAFALAEYMGANIIALMGQDLSFREKLHAGDVTGLFYSENDMEEYKRRNPIVKDIFGEERYTMGQFLGFRTSFEEAIKRFEGMVINTTEGGLPIEGAQTMRLKDFLDQYCNITPMDIIEIVEPLGDIPTTYDLPALMAHIRNGIKKFMRIRKNSMEIIECVLRLKELKDADMLKSGEAVYLIKKIEKREKVLEDPILGVIASYRYRMENYMRRNEIESDTFDAIQDSLDYYGNLIEAINIFLDRLDGLIEALERESKIDGILADEALHAIDRYCRAGALDIETGMAREATKVFENALTEFSSLVDPESQKEYWPVALRAHASLAELYLKQHRFYEAKEILEVLNVFICNNEVEIHDIGLDRETMTKLLNICRERVSMWEERKTKAVILLNKSMANYGSHLESGWFYSRVGDAERAEQSYLKAIGEARSLILGNFAQPAIAASHMIRIVGAHYGLAQTYLTMERQNDAITTLDSGRQEIERLFSFDLLEAIEEFGILFVDLYLSMGERKRAEDVCQQVLTIVPNSIALKEKIQAFGHREKDQLMEARP
jgi:hypothetical protein